MELQPRLIDVAVPDRPAGVVLVLHGGASRRRSMMVSPTQLSVLRMIPIARRIVRAELAVLRLLNSRRGWDTTHTPVHDAEWALEQVTDRFGEGLPLCLVGHSLGGRAAILTAGRPSVHSVVALAPWVYPTDVPVGLSGQRILIVHGARDRIASPARSAALARQLSRLTPAAHVTVEGAKHAMLRRHAIFSELSADFAATTLLGTPPSPTIARIEAGETWLQL
jgi:dienelactone hydrolase